MSLSIRTHIPFSTWMAEDDDAIDTAIRLINDADREDDREQKRWEARQNR